MDFTESKLGRAPGGGRRSLRFWLPALPITGKRCAAGLPQSPPLAR